MGYPFDKKWSNIPGQDTILYELMVAKDPNYPHIKVQDFAIYRTTKKEIDTQKDWISRFVTGSKVEYTDSYKL